jgi:uncharacterized membrane protein YoaK (UPF0700 family)
VTGLVDAASYLKLGHVFVANMTGNVVFLGFAIVGASLFAIAAFPADHPGRPARDVLVVVLALAMGLQNAVARRLAVPDLTTTVLTLTLTGIGADSSLGGGAGSKSGRRLMAVTAMLAGALAGGLLALHVSIAAPLAVAAAVLAVIAVVTHRLRGPDAPWASVTRGAE